MEDLTTNMSMADCRRKIPVFDAKSTMAARLRGTPPEASAAVGGSMKSQKLKLKMIFKNVMINIKPDKTPQ
jgi:hypothetical protein